MQSFRLAVYRIITSAYIHAGILHILMNMMSVYYLGLQVEPLIGTLPFLGAFQAVSVLTSRLRIGLLTSAYRASTCFLSLWFCVFFLSFAGLCLLFNVLQDLLYLFIQSFLTFLPTWFSGGCAIGFSGVIFSIIMVEVHTNPNGMRKCVECPARVSCLSLSSASPSLPLLLPLHPP